MTEPLGNPRRGETLRGGRFVLLGALGEGSQGQTFDAVDKGEGQPVAIKRFDVRGASSWKDVDLAEREARVLQSLSHPKLPRYVDHFEEDGALYLVMEKIEGASLASLRRRGETLGEDDVVRLLRDAADVLDYLHGRSPPVIHRDLKPGNVLRRPDGSFAFVDFGAVRDKLRPEGGSTVVGTFGYMAPEQFQGRALPGSDVYAVGATALAMLTGKEPEALPHRGLAVDVRAALRGQASEALIGVLERMLDPDPDRRPQQIAPLLGRLEKGGRRDARSYNEEQRARVRAFHEEHQARVRAVHEEKQARRESRRFDRLARRDARDAARRSERAAGRDRRHRGPPFPFSLVLAILFRVGMLAVLIATQLVVPLVLTILSLVFARRGLRRAVAAVRDAGDHAVRAIDHAREEVFDLREDDAGAEEPRVRVEAPPTRVGDATEPGDEDGDERAEEDAQEKGRSVKR